MKFGVFFPNFGEYYDPRTLAELAHDAEAAGWDEFFIADHMSLGGHDRFADPWIALAAIAMRTDGHPAAASPSWKVAREAVSLDRLSNGRLILGVGLGSPSDLEFERFGEPGDPKVRAAMLDESLDVLSGLWSGEPFKYQGVHYRLEETTFLPGPVQSPRIPIWVAGTWPRMAPLRRALKWDGYFPESTTPDDIRDVVEFVATNRASGGPFDIAFGNRRPMAEHARQLEEIAAYAEAGLTWWMQRLGPSYGSFQESRAHLRRGPPTV